MKKEYNVRVEDNGSAYLLVLNKKDKKEKSIRGQRR